MIPRPPTAAPVVYVRNLYNLAHRDDDALIDTLAEAGTAFVPFVPLGGFTPVQSATLSDAARRPGAIPMQVALAWLLRRSSKVPLIPGSAPIARLTENLRAGAYAIPDAVLTDLNTTGGTPARKTARRTPAR